MRTIEQLITQYAAYHRDRRNIATHFVGIPLIVFSVMLAFAHVSLGAVHAGWLVALGFSIYYLLLDRPLGLAMACYLGLNGIVASILAAHTGMLTGLVLAFGIFVAGWIIQFVGHHYEGVKPAFMDDIMGLAIGPLFVVTELFFMLGARPELKHYVEARVGPVLAERNGAPIGPAV